MKTTIQMRLFSLVLTLTMLIGMIPMAAMATAYPVIISEQEVTVTLNGTDITEAIYKFVPEKDGTYIFYSYDSDYDTYGHLLDSNMEELTYNDDGGEGHNFRVEYAMTAGTTYYLKNRYFNQTNSGSFKFKVIEGVPATSLTITNDRPLTLNEGDNDIIDYELAPANYIYEDVVISSDNTSVISVDGDYIFALKAGTATVTATSENGLTDSITITVNDTPELLPDTEYAVYSGTNNVYYKFTPEEDGTYGFYSYNNNGIDVDLTLIEYASNALWKSGNEMPDGNERIECDLTADKTYLFIIDADDDTTLNVKLQKLVPATGIAFDEGTYSATVGITLRPTVSFAPDNAIHERYTFTSADESVATVNDDGSIYLLAVGSTEITVTSDSGFTDTCTLTVTDYRDLSLEKSVSLEITDVVKEDYYSFTPERDGTYLFSSLGSLDTHGYIYDKDLNMLAENDDGGSNNNFSVSYGMTAGTEYILSASMHNVDSTLTGTVRVQVVMVDGNGNVLHNIEEYTHTDTIHSGYCKDCGTEIFQEHSFDADGNCVCGCVHEHKFEYSYYEEGHEEYCDLCNFSNSGEHSFDADGVCICGYTEHTHLYGWSDPYIDYHVSICIVCMLETENKHSFDGDGVCICGYTDHTHTGEYLYNCEIAHTLICSVCGLYVDEEHKPDTDGKCDCGYKQHQHSFTVYEYDLEYHSLVCADCGTICGDGSGEPHYIDENGACVCGYVPSKNVFIGSKTLAEGQYLDADGNVTDNEPALWSAYYADGVLTLNNLTVNATGEDECAILAGTDLEIVVNGTVELSSKDEDTLRLSKGDLTLKGTGTLKITAKGDYDGIDAASNGDVTIDGPTVIIEAVDNGIEAEEKFTMNSGTVIIESGDDGVDTEDAEINGGAMVICAEDIGIDAVDNTTVNGGYVSITANDENGFEAGECITVNGGDIVIDADECGFKALEEKIMVNGGDIRIDSVDGAVCAYESISIDESIGKFDTVYDNEHGLYFLAENGKITTSIHLTAEEENGTEIKNGWIALSADSAHRTGENLLPEITVTNADDKTLEEGTDYTLTWSADEAVEEGVYYAVIKGTGSYSGTQYAVFRVFDTQVYVGGVMMQSGDYLASGATETSTEKPAEGGYAYFAGGVLELNNYKYDGEGYNYDSYGNYTAAIYSNDELTVKLVGASSLINTKKDSDGITVYDTLTLTGSGSLDITSDYGIYNYNSDVIIDGGTLALSCISVGIYTGHDLTVNGGIVVIDGIYGIDANNTVTVKDGYMDISADKIAVRSSRLELSDDMAAVLPEEAEIKCINYIYYVFADGKVLGDVTFAASADTMMYGDANCDGSVNLDDVLLILKAIAKWDVMMNAVAADTNADGSVDLSDVLLILKYIAKWDVTLGK